MVKWLPEVLAQIKAFAGSNKVSFTYKALREIAELHLGLDETDVCHLLLDLKISDFKERRHSNITDEWLYIFLISVEDCQIYLKLISRNNCLIISFHEDRPNE